MCGIAGLLGPEQNPNRDLLERVRLAVAAMRHRGPDDEVATGIVGRGAWGMCRLAIRDPSPAGRQPFWYGPVGVIFNGEIYNTEELSSTLQARGHVFRTGCDTEVLLKAYVEFGSAAFGLLDGIFAVAVVDPVSDSFLLARDEFGVKPLFVSATSSRLAFASEPKALDVLGALDGGVDDEQLIRYLRYQYVPEPHSAWLNVRKVTRGTVEVYSLEDLRLQRTERFAQPGAGEAQPTSVDEWVQRTDEVLGLSVRRQMVSDRPLGVFLSGGVDSTLISGYASDVHAGVRAFGVSVPGWEHDERAYMEEACAILDVDLTITDLTEDDFDRLTNRLLDTYDEPFGDFSAIPTMLVSEVAGRELRVVLSGDGGDELFGGYSRYAHAPLAERLGRLPGPVLRCASEALTAVGRGPRWILDRVIDEVAGGGHGYAALLALRTNEQASSLLGRVSELPSALAPCTGSKPWRSSGAWAAAMSIDLDQYLPADINTKVDRATMSVSLEARVPFLGAPVARLAEAMPTSIKIHDGIAKWPLKELLRRRGFGEAFINRPKVGFSFPISEWLRRAIVRRPDLEALLRDPLPPLDRAASSLCLDSMLAGQDTGHAVWSVLVLSAWLTRFGK